MCIRDRFGRGITGTTEHAATLYLDHHRIAAAVAELLLHLSGLYRTLQPQGLAGQSRLVLFVTHRNVLFLQYASETGESVSDSLDAIPFPAVRES